MFNYKSTFFLVATPIGNLKDITYRAVEVLQNVDMIACEDTRYTLRLLDTYGIKKKLISYHKYTNVNKDNYIIDLLKSGLNIALVSDAGMPLIADPGSNLVNNIISNNIKIEVIPGACSVINALAISNMSLSNFVFAGWMPKKSNQKLKELTKFLEFSQTVVFLDSPYRIKKTIDTFYNDFINNQSLLLSNLHVSIAREMTKLHEEVIRGTLVEVHTVLSSREIIKGEIVVVFGKK